MRDIEYKRGQVWWAISKASAEEATHLQKGRRPFLIISNDSCNKYSPVVTVVPLTRSTTKRNLPTHVEIQNDRGVCSTVLCEGVTSIDKDKFIYYKGYLDVDSMCLVDNALKIHLELERKTYEEVTTPNLAKPAKLFTIEESQVFIKDYKTMSMQEVRDKYSLSKQAVDGYIKFFNSRGWVDAFMCAK